MDRANGATEYTLNAKMTVTGELNEEDVVNAADMMIANPAPFTFDSVDVTNINYNSNVFEMNLYYSTAAPVIPDPEPEVDPITYTVNYWFKDVANDATEYVMDPSLTVTGEITEGQTVTAASQQLANPGSYKFDSADVAEITYEGNVFEMNLYYSTEAPVIPNPKPTPSTTGSWTVPTVPPNTP